MVDMGFASHKMIAIALSIQYNLPFISLSAQWIDPRLRELVPAELALRWRLLPMAIEEGVLTVAVADPSEGEYKEELRARTGLAVSEVVATPQDLTRALATFYA
jgi:type IV pilus assembly protein PilB